MSHEILGSDGMFTVRQAAWHGLGHVFEDYPSRAEAQAIAHPWEPEQKPLYRQVTVLDENGEPVMKQEGVDENGEPVLVEQHTYVEVTSHKVNVRDDTGEALGVVSEGYTNVLNTELWDIAEAIERSGDDVMFETGGSLRGGAHVWTMVRLNEPITINGDPRGETIPYFALQNSHDGTGAFKGMATMTRIVCANTARIADMEATARGTEFTFRHSKNVGERIDQAKEALSGWRESVQVWKETSERLISQKIEPLKSAEYLERFIPMPPENLLTELSRKNILRDRERWLESYNGITGEGLKDTSYGLIQASIEFLNWHRRANSQENRFRRTFLSRDALVSNAVDLANQAYQDSQYIAQGSVLA